MQQLTWEQQKQGEEEGKLQEQKQLSRELRWSLLVQDWLQVNTEQIVGDSVQVSPCALVESHTPDTEQQVT